MESSGSGSESSVSANLQKAMEDLRAAGEKATGEVRTNIDDAVERLREASSDASARASDQVADWRSTLEEAAEDLRKEFGLMAVRAQDSLESIDEIDKELDERRKSLGGEGSSS